MSVYLVAHVKVTNDAWLPGYAADVHGIVEKHGGRYLCRNGVGTALEGAKPDADAVAILEFPAEENALAFANDPAYAPHATARQAGSVTTMFIVEGKDMMGTVPYLPKA